MFADFFFFFGQYSAKIATISVLFLSAVGKSVPLLLMVMCNVLSLGWPIMLGLTGIPAAIQLLLLPFFPESPRYMLIQKGDEKTAKKGIEGVILVSHVRAHKENVRFTAGCAPTMNSSRLQRFYDGVGLALSSLFFMLQHLDTQLVCSLLHLKVFPYYSEF